MRAALHDCSTRQETGVNTCRCQCGLFAGSRCVPGRPGHHRGEVGLHSIRFADAGVLRSLGEAAMPSRHIRLMPVGATRPRRDMRRATMCSEEVAHGRPIAPSSKQAALPNGACLGSQRRWHFRCGWQGDTGLDRARARMPIEASLQTASIADRNCPSPRSKDFGISEHNALGLSPTSFHNFWRDAPPSGRSS